MGTPNPAILEDLVQRHLDDDLNGPELKVLEQHLRTSASLRREQEQLRGVFALLDEGRIPVEAGFERRVMNSLPAAGWEARSARSWRLPVAVLVAFAVLGTVLAKAAQPAAGSIAGALSAAFDLMMTAALTGFGLLGASWKGLQAVFRGLGTGSPWVMVGLVALVLGANLLLFFALRSRPRLAPATKEIKSGNKRS
ncbi:MAG: hypothetical protein KDD47_00695 [Acidobacteria bacterium]|nr:hypothetical protein [Acidobacteriota bacterium]